MATIVELMKNKPIIYVSKDSFTLGGNAWELYLALKLLFETIHKSQPEAYNIICKNLINCGAVEVK